MKTFCITNAIFFFQEKQNIPKTDSLWNYSISFIRLQVAILLSVKPKVLFIYFVCETVTLPLKLLSWDDDDELQEFWICII